MLARAGVAGWQGGWAIAMAWFAGAGAALAFVATRRRPGSGLYVAAATILGITGSVLVTDRAPESHGRLESRLDDLRLDFYEPVSDRRTGHGWCSPSCPAVERTWRGPYVNERTAQVQAAAALHDAGLLPDIALRLSTRQTSSIEGSSDRLRARATVDQQEDGRIVLRVRLSAKRL